MALTGPNTDFVIVSPAAPFAVNRDRQVLVEIAYTPSAVAADSQTLAVASAEVPAVTASLSGSGVAGVADINMSPTPLDFGTVKFGVVAKDSVYIQNPGTGDLTVTGLVLAGDPDFTLVNPPATPFTVKAGRQARLRVNYAAITDGAASATVTVDSEDGGVPLPQATAALSGTGDPGGPDINVPSAALAFGDVEIGTIAEGYVTIQNLGNVELTVSALTMTGSPDFATSQALPLVIGPNRQAQVPVTYAPGAEGAAAGTMTIASDDPVDPSLAVSLSGNGTVTVGAPAINLPVTALNYGDVFVGQTRTSTVAIQNVGNADLIVTGLPITGPESAFFSVSGPTSFTVAAGRQVSVEVTYAPGAPDAAAATMTVVSNDVDVPVSLTGNGLAGTQDIHLPVVAFDFGDVITGTTATGYIAIQNVGTADLTVTSLGLTGSPDLVLQTSAPIVIAPSRQVTVRVDFTPSATGPVTGLLTIGSDDTDEPSLTVDILGNGISPPA
jgi:hypothetical protein